METKEESSPTKLSIKGYSTKDVETRVVKNFLYIIILIEIKKQSCLSGYDAIGFVNAKFGEMLSPGTV